MKPNLFNIATKELSQDAFITWLLQWADDDCLQYDEELSITAKEFARLLVDEKDNFDIKSVSVGRQWNNIDIWAEINDDIFIAIEDKTNTGEHSKQLERYKEISFEHYKNKRNRLFFIYLKTGNESISTLKKIEEKGYKIIDRKMILSVLNKSKSQNAILCDFRENLNLIETRTNSFNKLENIISDWRAAEGFYLKLQEMILPEWSDWRYVANQIGGFLGFWYNWVDCGNYCLHIQIENAFDFGIKLAIKIDDWKPDIDTLYLVLSELQTIAQKNGITLVKPNRYRAGETSTVAIVENAFHTENDEMFDIDIFYKTLKNMEKILKTHSINKEKEK